MMKCIIPEISWHNRDPVLSVDFHCSKIIENSNDKEIWRLATGGADSHVLIWHVEINKVGAVSITCVTDLSRHQKTVNVVRFSPSGDILASGDDESVIILWKQKENSELLSLSGEDNINKEQWMSWKVLRGHLEDIYDISWSPDSNMLVSGSVDNTAIVWDVNKGRSMNILQDYKGFVQGVVWDPLNQYIATMSTDRQCRLIDLNTMKTIQRANKAKIPTPPGHRLEGKIIRLFHDDTFKSFFRRLTFTMDGSLIIVPSGIIEPDESTERPLNATIIFSRYNMKEPLMILPTLDEPTIVARCCPVYFELRNDGPVPIIATPYRMIFAVATQKSIFIYDTQQLSPIAVVSNIHYTRLTDIAWSSDGRILVVSSTDGYCSIIHFNDGELGKNYTGDKSISMSKQCAHENNSCKVNLKSTIQKQPYLVDIGNEAMDFDAAINLKAQDYCPSNSSSIILSKGNDKLKSHNNNISIQNKDIENIEDNTEDIKLIYNETSINQQSVITSNENLNENNDKDILPLANITKTTTSKATLMPIHSVKTPRRVQLITLSSPKRKKN